MFRQHGQLKSFQSTFLLSIFSLPVSLQDFMYFIFEIQYTKPTRQTLLFSIMARKTCTKSWVGRIDPWAGGLLNIGCSLVLVVQQMGQGSSSESLVSNKQLLDKLAFVLAEQTPHYGELLIYRLTQKPYDYYLRYREIYQQNSQNQSHIAKTQQFYESLKGHRNIVRVEITHIDKSLDLCSSSIIFDSYARYHNYTLEKAIQCKRSNSKMFRDSDLLYVLTSLIEVGALMAANTKRLYLGVFKTNRIYLSTEGFIKIYPFRVHTLATMSQQSLAETSQESDLQVSSASREYEKEDSYKTNQTDIRDIAFLMTQLCLLENKNQLEALTKQHTRFRLQKGLAGRVSQGIRMLITRLLQGEDIDWEALRAQLEIIKNHEGIRPAYCIRLEEDISMRQSEIIMRQNEEMSMQKASRHLMLSSVQMNLVASRIEPVSRKGQKH